MVYDILYYWAICCNDKFDNSNKKYPYYNAKSEIELTDKDSEIFKNTQCPACGKFNLVKTTSDEDYQYIECKENYIFLWGFGIILKSPKPVIKWFYLK